MDLYKSEFIDKLRGICGNEYVLTGTGELTPYGRDGTLGLSCAFEVLIKPGTADEVAATLKACNHFQIPVTPRGGGSGVTGGALPVRGGVVMSLERMNKIIEINREDAYVISEAGVVTADLCNAVKRCGLYFPVEPTSSHSSFVGGNVATNAGSMKSCKYGKTKDYVLNLEVAMPDGSVTWTGRNIRKDSTGLNITQLFVGSEGMLGVITKVVYKVLHQPSDEIYVLAAFDKLEDAWHVLADVRRLGLSPSAAEFIGRNAIGLTNAYLGGNALLANENADAHLLIGVEGGIGVREEMGVIVRKLKERTVSSRIVIADSPETRTEVGRLRRSIGDAMKAGKLAYRDVDICVPFSLLFRYLKETEAIGDRYKLSLITFGHALDGNLHVMVGVDSKQSGSDSPFRRSLQEIYSFALENGGVISGEHGIGLLQREFLGIQFPGNQLSLMKRIKELLDPNGILNPGKSFA